MFIVKLKKNINKISFCSFSLFPISKVLGMQSYNSTNILKNNNDYKNNNIIEIDKSKNVNKTYHNNKIIINPNKININPNNIIIDDYKFNKFNKFNNNNNNNINIDNNNNINIDNNNSINIDNNNNINNNNIIIIDLNKNNSIDLNKNNSIDLNKNEFLNKKRNATDQSLNIFINTCLQTNLADRAELYNQINRLKNHSEDKSILLTKSYIRNEFFNNVIDYLSKFIPTEDFPKYKFTLNKYYKDYDIDYIDTDYFHNLFNNNIRSFLEKEVTISYHDEKISFGKVNIIDFFNTNQSIDLAIFLNTPNLCFYKIIFFDENKLKTLPDNILNFFKLKKLKLSSRFTLEDYIKNIIIIITQLHHFAYKNNMLAAMYLVNQLSVKIIEISKNEISSLNNNNNNYNNKSNLTNIYNNNKLSLTKFNNINDELNITNNITN